MGNTDIRQKLNNYIGKITIAKFMHVMQSVHHLNILYALVHTKIKYEGETYMELYL